MALFALFIGVVLIVAAIRNSHGALFSALSTDVPEFVTWAAAIVAIGIIGFVPGLKPVSRGLLALVIVVIILQNYQEILKGFQNAWQHPNATTATPASKTATSSPINIPNALDIFTPPGFGGGFANG